MEMAYNHVSLIKLDSPRSRSCQPFWHKEIELFDPMTINFDA